MCKSLIVDNFDSFTYNLYQYMGEVCGEEPDVVLNNVDPRSIDLKKYDCIIISPGPGTPVNPADVGISSSMMLHSGKPVLGVCLGHQLMGHLHGMEVGLAPQPVHGRISVIQHDGSGVFADLPNPLSIVRYHSLVIKAVQEPFVLTAWGDDGMVHGIRHRQKPLYGVQFHPESISSQSGRELLRNFRDISLRHGKR